MAFPDREKMSVNFVRWEDAWHIQEVVRRLCGWCEQGEHRSCSQRNQPDQIMEGFAGCDNQSLGRRLWESSEQIMT